MGEILRTQALLLVVLLLLPLAGALERSASGSEDLYIVFAPLSDRRGIESLERTVEQLGGEVLEEFSLLRAALVKGSRELASSLGRLGYQVSRNLALHLTTPLQAEQPSLRHGVPNVGAPSAWALGLNGSGVKVAVIDTGIENNHPWLMRGGKSVVAWEVDATGKGELDYCGKRTALASAHGTHVAGIIASQDSENRGVAPGVMLYDIIAFSRDYQCIYTDEATLMRALEYALKGPDGRPGTGDEADVINLSLGTVLPLEPLYSVMRGRGTKPAMIEALERAAVMNKVLVVAVGNGYGINLFNTLCLASEVICVGAADDARNADPRDDRLAPFSSRGPGFLATFVPHLVAPGVSIESSVPTETGALSSSLSGTSMSTAFVTGAAAILVQQAKREGAVSPREILRALVQTARDVKGYNVTGWDRRFYLPLHAVTVSDQGAGLLNISAAVRREITIDLDGRPLAHLLVPRSGRLALRVNNLVDSPLELSLSVVAKEEHSLGEVSSLLSLNASRITLAPRSFALVEFSFRDLQVGTYGGYLILRSSSSSYRFPFLLTVPLELPPEGGLLALSLQLKAISRSMRDIPMLYVDVKRPFPDPFFLSAAVSAEIHYNVVPGIAVVSPSGTASTSYDYNHLYVFLEPDLYLLIARVFPFVTSPVELKLLMGAVSRGEGIHWTREAISSLSARLEALELELKGLKASVANLNASLLNLKMALETLGEELRKESERRRTEVERLNTSIAALQRSMATLDEAVRVLSFELRRESEQRKVDVARIEQSLTALQKSLSLLEEGLRALREELQREIAEREAEIERVERLIREESEQRRAEVARLSENVGLLQRILSSIEEASRALRGDLQRESEARRAEVYRLESAIRAAQQAISSLEGSLRALGLSLESLERRVMSANESLRAAIRAEAERVSRLEGEARALRASLEEAARELGNRITSLSQDVDTRSQQLQREVEQLREELETARLVGGGGLLVALISLGVGVYLAFLSRKL